jgi:hypothetical protein
MLYLLVYFVAVVPWGAIAALTRRHWRWIALGFVAQVGAAVAVLRWGRGW